VQTSLSNRSVYSLAVSGSSIFAGTNTYGVYRSTDYGNSWVQTSLNNRHIYALLLNGSSIFAGTNANGVYRSTDNGNTWVQTSLNNRNVYSFAVIGSNIFAGTDYNGGIYRSTDNGNSWTLIGLNTRDVYCITANGNNIIAGTSGNGVYLSTNNGSTWLQKNEGFITSPIVRGLLITSAYFFAGTVGQSVWRRPVGELYIKNISAEIPTDYFLYQNYPNPFNANTKIKFSIRPHLYPPLNKGEKPELSRRGVVTLKIYDILGREITTLVNEPLKPGTYEVEWDGSNCSSGIYFCQLITEDYTDTNIMTLSK
jgi:hypothetical protein